MVLDESLVNVAAAAEVFSVHLNDVCFDVFLKAYGAAVDALVLYPGDPRRAYDAALWLDSIRWLVLNRACRIKTVNGRRFVHSFFSLFFFPSSDPWCGFCMSHGLDCKSCPMLYFRMVRPSSNALVGADSYLYCSMFGAVSRVVGRKLFEVRTDSDFLEFKSYLRRVIHKTPPTLMFEESKVDEFLRKSGLLSNASLPANSTA